jgi:hypothetical protein
MTTKIYSFWYSEVFSHRGYFKADSIQEADEMLRLLNAGDIGLDDLPSFRSKGVEHELVAEQAEPEQAMPSIDSLHYRKVSADYLAGDSPSVIRERFEGIIPDNELDELLTFVTRRFVDTIRSEA